MTVFHIYRCLDRIYSYSICSYASEANTSPNRIEVFNSNNNYYYVYAYNYNVCFPHSE